MAKRHEPVEYWTFTFGVLKEPLTILLGELDRLPSQPGGNEVQVSPYEHGISHAVFLIVGAMIEGTIHCFRMGLAEDMPPYESAFEYLKGKCETYSYWENTGWDKGMRSVLVTEIDEVLTVRDSVAHAHVWMGTIDPIQMKWVEGPARDKSGRFGSSRYRRVTDNGIVTKLFRLNVLPSKIGRTDVAIGVKSLDRLWEMMGTTERGGVFISARQDFVGWREDYIEFSEVAQQLFDEWRV